MSIELSIIIPIYNAAGYLPRCIDSILNQSFENFELILINDGSSDNSGEICEEYKNLDNRIWVYHLENSGPGAARNYGIKKARGKYVGFVDSDDFIHLDMYKKMLESVKMNQKDIQVIMCNYEYLNMNTKQSTVVRPPLQANTLFNKKMIRENIITKFSGIENYGFYIMCNKIYLREWLLDNQLLVEEKRTHGEDWWFNLQVFMKLDSFYYLDEVYYYYCFVNSNSLMTKYRADQFELYLDGRLKFLSLIPKDLINYNELNKQFMLQNSQFIVRTLNEVKDKKERNQIIEKVLNNKEFIDCCKSSHSFPKNYRIISILMNMKLKWLARQIYFLRSKIG